MFSHAPNSPQTQDADPLGIVRTAIARLTVLQLAELARMREMGMRYAEGLERWATGGSLPLAEELAYRRRSRGVIRDFVSVARAIRQIIVLEMELTGQREPDRSRPRRRPEPDFDIAPVGRIRPLNPLAPLRDNLGDAHDHEPVGIAVDWIRETLAIDTPENDPFLTPASRARKEAAQREATQAAPDPDTYDPPQPQPRPTRRRRPIFPANAWSPSYGPDMSVAPMPPTAESPGTPPRGPP